MVSVTSPYDPRTVDGVWRESIDETMAMTTSMNIAFHTVKAMKENATRRDSATGHCDKNGGVPPYGYRAKRIPVGKDSKGKERTKCCGRLIPTLPPLYAALLSTGGLVKGFPMREYATG